MTWREWLSFFLLAVLIWTLTDWRPIKRRRTSRVEDLPPIKIEWRPDLSVFDSPSKFGYQIYTDRYDQTVEAARLPSRPGGEQRRQMLDKIIQINAEATAQLTNLLRERGIGRELCASLLVDHSGSMNRKAGTGPDQRSERGDEVTADSGAALAAGVTMSIALALEHTGARTEILGFTTGEWKGGKSRKDWLESGKPPRPGRLNDLLHIVYKLADEHATSGWHYRMQALLCPSYLKENIDGEAIAWARSRLLAQSAADRLLIVISDGAPVDDSTLQANGPCYLERHLLHVIEDINRRNDIRIIGIGIGYDLSRYLPGSCVVRGLGDTFTQQIHAIVDLIAKPV
jgi:cobaltochelatase CobT